MAETKTNDEKVAKTLTKLMKVINKQGFTIPELLVLYGNLGYHIGSSVAGFQGIPGPNLAELKAEYYQDPTVDVGLMLQGLLITNWEKDFMQQPKLSSFARNNKRIKEKEKK